jgi:cytochrome P450
MVKRSPNRDERHFDKPDEFDVRRITKGRGHLSFGYGLHLCLGAALARMEGRVALEEMLKRWPAWDVDYSRATKAHTTSVRGWDTLPIIPRVS